MKLYPYCVKKKIKSRSVGSVFYRISIIIIHFLWPENSLIMNLQLELLKFSSSFFFFYLFVPLFFCFFFFFFNLFAFFLIFSLFYFLLLKTIYFFFFSIFFSKLRERLQNTEDEPNKIIIKCSDLLHYVSFLKWLHKIWKIPAF